MNHWTCPAILFGSVTSWTQDTSPHPRLHAQDVMCIVHKWVLTFWRITVCLHLCGREVSLLGLLDPEDEGTVILRNVIHQRTGTLGALL